MNQEPLFSNAIAESKLHDEQAARHDAAQRQREQSEKARQMAAANAALQVLVKPLLGRALHELQQAGIAADAGNGADAYGETRLSLALPGKRHRPALIFTAITQSAVPHLAWHVEHTETTRQALPQRIPNPTEAGIQEIIARFIATPQAP